MALILFAAATLSAQQADLPKPGTVLFSTGQTTPQTQAQSTAAIPDLTPAGRNAPTITGYDLDVHLAPADAGIAVRARLNLRNDGPAPLQYLPLQLSSTLTWDSISLDGKPVPFAQHLLDTDADHTGKANEAVLTLPGSLSPKASLTLTAFYSGAIHASAERLERIGAPLTQAANADWDAIAPVLTALRGFGNVLWYPVAAEPVFLGDGAKLFQAVGAQRLRQQHATIRLRLAVQYVGDPPDAAIVNGQRQLLTAVSENKDVPIAEARGVASADFAAAPLGFRSPSLFVTGRAPTVTGPEGDATLIAAVTDHYDALPQYAAAAALVQPLLTDWLGPAPLSQVILIDHPGQPFEDGSLAVLPLRASTPASLAPSLVHTLAHAWFRSARPWLDEGVPQLLSLLWTEQSQSHTAALDLLQQGAKTLALAEPGGAAQAGQPLIAARDNIFYRTKAAAVLWQLRALAGDDALKQTLLTYRINAKQDANPEGFETALESYAHKDLRWFFDDWVYRDPGLPDLSIVNVTPRELPAQGTKPPAWLVAVEVRNDGDAVADVPVTVRSGTLTATERLRVPAHASAATRILFESTPREVAVNDGSVPELRAATHTIQIKPRTP